MRTDTKAKIVDFVEKNERVSAKAIVGYLKMAPTGVFRHLLKLTNDGILVKQGTPPKVFYSKKTDSGTLKRSEPSANLAIKTGSIQTESQKNKGASDEEDLDPETRKLIEKNFLKVVPDGTMIQGVSAFYAWCKSRGLDPIKSSKEYRDILQKMDTFKKKGFVDGIRKMQQAFPTVFVDQMYYLDFYAIERFGKTRLGELILYAKQSQNKHLVRLITEDVKKRIEEAIKRLHVDAVGFIPPTIKRDVQFMKELESDLALSVPSMKITKIKTPIIVPQKTLSKLEERVENARQSIVVEETIPYDTILLIDDAVGSGATINEVARQIKQRNICRKELIGLGLVGSANGFEVIREA